MEATWTYFAPDGSYGDARDLLIIDTTNLTPGDWDAIEDAHDLGRPHTAELAAVSVDAYIIPLSEHTILNTDGACERCRHITDDEVVRSYESVVR
jgi:hypothetical protein